MDIALLVVALFIPFFAAVWIGVVYLVSAMSGWRELATRFSGNVSLSEKTFNAATATMNRGDRPGAMPGRYRNTLVVELGAEGIGLRPWKPFKFGHPPLRIPWGEIEACHSESYVFGTRCLIVTREPRFAIVFYGEAGKSVLEFCRRQNASAVK